MQRCQQRAQVEVHERAASVQLVVKCLLASRGVRAAPLSGPSRGARSAQRGDPGVQRCQQCTALPVHPRMKIVDMILQSVLASGVSVRLRSGGCMGAHAQRSGGTQVECVPSSALSFRSIPKRRL